MESSAWIVYLPENEEKWNKKIKKRVIFNHFGKEQKRKNICIIWTVNMFWKFFGMCKQQSETLLINMFRAYIRNVRVAKQG